MLIKDFYNITEFQEFDDEINVKIHLNPEHEVYDGHFKGQPVVPGVIQLQIIKEVVEKSTGKELFMNNIIQVKYLIPIIPKSEPLLINIKKLASESRKVKITAVVTTEDIVFTKAKIEFTIT